MAPPSQPNLIIGSVIYQTVPHVRLPDSTLTAAQQMQYGLATIRDDLARLQGQDAKRTGVDPRALASSAQHVAGQENATYAALKAEGQVHPNWGIGNNRAMPTPGMMEFSMTNAMDRMYAGQAVRQVTDAHADLRQLYQDRRLPASMALVGQAEALERQTGSPSAFPQPDRLPTFVPTTVPGGKQPLGTRFFSPVPQSPLPDSHYHAAEAHLAGLTVLGDELKALQKLGPRNSGVDPKSMESAMSYWKLQNQMTGNAVTRLDKPGGEMRVAVAREVLRDPVAMQAAGQFMRDIVERGHIEIRQIQRNGLLPQTTHLGDQVKPAPAVVTSAPVERAPAQQAPVPAQQPQVPAQQPQVPAQQPQVPAQQPQAAAQQPQAAAGPASDYPAHLNPFRNMTSAAKQAAPAAPVSDYPAHLNPFQNRSSAANLGSERPFQAPVVPGRPAQPLPQAPAPAVQNQAQSQQR
ncbi:hypothetical protein [Actinoplanes sp. NPDC051851]|uniref:hypothetical protein n=1 Tax=Actinoplanes sp. NPDC051851 TaxID=3154753 RepID=UPI003438AD59